MDAAIETQGLTRRFGKQTAVDGLDLVAPRNAVYGFLGPNGAGKTTTIRMVLGLIRPNAGSVSVFGADVAKERLKSAAMIGSMVEEPALYYRLTGRENLEVSRKLLGCPRTEIDRVLEIVDLKAAADRLAGTYSQGMRQRLGLARALMGGPKLLVLDEPTNGLDPDGIRDIRDLIRALPQRDNVTVFVSSHLLAEVEQMATHVGVMHKGRLLIQGSMAQLKSAAAGVAQVGVTDAQGAARHLAASGVAAVITAPDQLQIDLPAGEAPNAFLSQINKRLVEGGFSVFSLALPQLSLEDIYLRATGDKAAA